MQCLHAEKAQIQQQRKGVAADRGRGPSQCHGTLTVAHRAGTASKTLPVICVASPLSATMWKGTCGHSHNLWLYWSPMDVSIAEAKNRLPELIRAMEDGEQVVIT